MSNSLSGSKRSDSVQPGHSSRTERIEGQKDAQETNNSNLEMECERLKHKLSKMMDNSRREREMKLKLERDIGLTNKRVEALL